MITSACFQYSYRQFNPSRLLIAHQLTIVHKNSIRLYIFFKKYFLTNFRHCNRFCLIFKYPGRNGLSFPAKCDIAVTGNPVREELLTIRKKQARAKLNLDERPVILSFGGSLGARKINEAVLELIQWSAKRGEYQHIHAYGQYGRWFPEKLSEKGISLKNHRELDVREYINDMPVCLAAADLVICRAGAITLSELQATGKAALLIPSPNVAENHQFYNAQVLVEAGAAICIEEKDLDGDALWNAIVQCSSDYNKRQKMGKAAKTLAVTDAADRIYAVIREVLNIA